LNVSTSEYSALGREITQSSSNAVLYAPLIELKASGTVAAVDIFNLLVLVDPVVSRLCTSDMYELSDAVS